MQSIGRFLCQGNSNIYDFKKILFYFLYIQSIQKFKNYFENKYFFGGGTKFLKGDFVPPYKKIAKRNVEPVANTGTGEVQHTNKTKTKICK